MIAVFSPVCSVLPTAPAFGNVSSSLGEDGALISWEYWGLEKDVYVEYLVMNSKHSSISTSSNTCTGGKRLLLCNWLVQVHRNNDREDGIGYCLWA